VVAFGTPVGIIAAQSIGEPGTQLTMRTFHMGGVATEGLSMTQGLSRVEELLEARSPSNPALLSEISGKVSVKKGRNDSKITIDAEKAEDDEYRLQYEMEAVVEKGDIIKERQVIARSTETKDTIRARCAGKVLSTNDGILIVRQDEAAKKQYTISSRSTILVHDGDSVKKGDLLTNGHIDLRQLMDLTSIEKAQAYILHEVQDIYASQGQDIDEKHIEIIVKQMASKVRVIDSGDSDWVIGEIHDVIECERENIGLRKKKKKEVRVERLLLGLTRIALWTDSWLSAASFQETIRALVNASVECRQDTLDGLKENVIIGRLIPAGTGYARSRAEKKQ